MKSSLSEGRLAKTTTYFKRKTVKAKGKTKEKIVEELSQWIAELETSETSGNGWRGYEN